MLALLNDVSKGTLRMNEIWFKVIPKWVLVVSAIILVILLVLFSINLYSLIERKVSNTQVISFGESSSKLTDVADIKKRMEFHGCLACWKDSCGVWWFDRNGEQCKLCQPKQDYRKGNHCEE